MQFITSKTKDDNVVEDRIKSLLSYANKTPELLSLLYDMDLLPEQLKQGTRDYSRMLMLINTWKNWTVTVQQWDTAIDRD